MRRDALQVPCGLAAALCATLAACAPHAHEPALEGTRARDSTEPAALAEVFPHVRAIPDGGVVEIDGFVPIDCHDPETPDVYLEVIVCARDTREHEALVATGARPAHIHAALLLAGIGPGAPGRFEWTDDGVVRHAPTGEGLRVEILVPGSPELPTDPREWIRDHNGQSLTSQDASGWVFAGSREVMREGRLRYDADGTGQIVGLHTFGSEVVAWTRVEHPDSAVDEPEWLADARMVPELGTAVVVRLTGD